MVAKYVLLNKYMFVLITDEKKDDGSIEGTVTWFLTLAVDVKQKESLNHFIGQICNHVNWVTNVMTT